MGRIDSGAGEPNKKSEAFEIRAKIRTRSEDFDKSLMILSGGDVLQWKALKALTMGEYLVKLDNYITSTAPPDTMGNVLKTAKFKSK